VIELATGHEPAIVDVTDRVVSFCHGRGDGLVNILAPHATAGLAIIEIGAGTEIDLLATLDRLLPRSHPWRHQHGAAGHGADHVLPALISPSVTVPVIDGRPTLGTWQSIVFVDPNRDNPIRQLRLSFIN
jgi:secondary thiamine-phosphate synthase enzyme